MDVKTISELIRIMERMGTAITGFPIKVEPITNKYDGIAYSYKDSKKNLIAINFSYDYKGLTEDQVQIILFGLYTHELMHLIRSDFDHKKKALNNYPAAELYDRHKIWNIVEDPAIEYQAPWHVSDYLANCLKKTISYFYDIAEPLEQCASDAYEEVLAALIMFGDVGVIKGNFQFDSARDAFIECAPIMLTAIEEHDATIRFDKSMEIFDVIHPLWINHNERLFANKSLADMLSKLGITESDGKGTPISNSKNPSLDDENQMRRKKIIHLISENQAKEKGIDQPNKKNSRITKNSLPDEFYAVDSNNPEDGVAISDDDYIVIDERDEVKESDMNTKHSNSKDDFNTSDKTEQSELSGDTKKSSSVQTNTNTNAINDSINNQHCKKNLFSETSSNDSKAKQDSDFFNKNNGNSSFKKMLGEKIEEISAEEQQHLQLDSERKINSDDTSQLKEILQTFKGILSKEIKKENKEANREIHKEDLFVTVRSPYYKDVKYSIENVESGSEQAYEELSESVKRYILNLSSRLKKIFVDPRAKIEYTTSGKVDVKRLSGRKMTARIFNKQRRTGEKKDIVVVIMVDESGSMSSNIKNVQKTCILLLEALSKFDIPVKVVGFSTRRYTDAVYCHYGTWKNNSSMRRSVTNMNASGSTFLGHAIRYGGELLRKRTEKHKIFIMITDGIPEYRIYSSKNDGCNDCKYAITDIKKYAHVIGIGIFKNKQDSNPFQFIFKEDGLVMNETSQLLIELPKLMAKIFKKI